MTLLSLLRRTLPAWSVLAVGLLASCTSVGPRPGSSAVRESDVVAERTEDEPSIDEALPATAKRPAAGQGVPLEPEQVSNGEAPPPDAPRAGSLDPEVIRDVIRSHFHKIAACYEDQLQHHPGLSGTVKVKFKIRPDGLVESAVILPGATLSSSVVQACIQGVVKAMKFPPPEGGGVVFVAYPFTFRSGPAPKVHKPADTSRFQESHYWNF